MSNSFCFFFAKIRSGCRSSGSQARFSWCIAVLRSGPEVENEAKAQQRFVRRCRSSTYPPDYRLNYGANKQVPPLFAEGDLPIASVCSNYFLSGPFSATESLQSLSDLRVREQLLLETQEGA